jgi:hypothetical protein
MICKREGIFFGVVFLWFVALIFSGIFMIIFGSKFLHEYGTLLSLIPTSILFFTIVPRIFSKKYNNWLESDVISPKPELTLKEIRLKKLKKINRYENKAWFRK